MANKLLFSEFLLTDRGIAFTEALEDGPSPAHSLEDALADLTNDLIVLSKSSTSPTYDPILKGIAAITQTAAQTMLKFGVAQRNLKDTKKHKVKTTGLKPQDVLRAIEAERQYHATMSSKKRKTIKQRSPSEMAFIMLGQMAEAHEAAANHDPNRALKLLKNVTAIGIRTLHESLQPNSLANRARAHFTSDKKRKDQLKPRRI